MSEVDALSYLDVVTATRADALEASARALLERAADEMRLAPDGSVGHLPDEYGPVAHWQHLSYPGPCWATEEGGVAELLLWPHDRWLEVPRGEPVFSAGFTFTAADGPPVLAEERTGWREELRARGIEVGREGPAVRVHRALYLADLVYRGRTFDAQVEALAAWADEAIAAVASRKPGAARRS